MFLYFFVFITGSIVWSVIHTHLCSSAFLLFLTIKTKIAVLWGYLVFVVIGLFCCYVTGFKTVLPLRGKDVFVRSWLFFLSGFIGVMSSGKFLNNNQQLQNYAPWWR